VILALPLLLIGLAVSAPAGAARPDPAPELRVGIADWIRVQAPWPVTRVEFPPLEDWARQYAGEARFAFATRPGQRLLGPVPVFVVVHDGEELVQEGTLTVSVHAELPVVVATRALRRGVILTVDDVTLEKRSVEELEESWLEDPRQAIGMRMAHRARQGAPLQASWLEAPPQVRRGDRLRLIVASGRLRIETVGRAREDAAAGEWIRVQNLASRRDVLARIDARGVAHAAR